MKHILLLPMALSLLALPQFSFAQKPAEPVEAPPAVDRAGASVGLSGGPMRKANNKATPPATATTGGGGSYFSGSSVNQSATANYFTASSRGDSIPPVVIRFSPPDAKASATLEEDLFVMARVISRTLERAETDQVNYKLGVPMLLTGSGRSVRPMYLEGMGPLFMIKVNFPLMPPAKAEEKTASTGAPDSEWTEAHREVFGGVETVTDDSSSRSSSYNEEQVEALKKELIGALKNAANIRGLKPEEYVNIAVFGHAGSSRVKSVTLGGLGGASAVGQYSAKSYVYETTDATGAAKGTVLTLRAKKSDIDAFASGKLEADTFKAKVAMTAYAGSGAGTTSINSWIQESVGRWRGQ